MEKIELPIEDDNVSPSKPDLWWLFKMLAIVISFVIFWYLIFYIFTYFIIWNITLEKEKEYFWNFWITSELKIFDFSKLINKIPDIDNYKIYVKNSSEVNAYAVIWWNIILTTGLLENLDYEEELIFILWHEIKHIENRDVLKAYLTNIPLLITLNYLWFETNNQIINISEITIKQINKNTELNADNWWIELINKMWLNLDCSSNFFKKENDIFANYLQLISSHPTNQKRIKNIKSKNENNEKECTKLNLEI